MPPLLRAPMDQALFTDVEIASAGPTLPVIRLAVCEVGLEPVVVGIVQHRRAGGDDVFQHLPRAFAERNQLTGAVVKNADRRRKPKGSRAMGHGERIFWSLDATADD